MTNYQRTYSIGEVEVEGSAIYHKTEYRERRNHYTVFACTRADRRASTPPRRVRRRPQRAARGGGAVRGAAHGLALGWNPIGSHQVDVALAPGEEESFAFVLAYVEQDGRRSSSVPAS